MPNNLWMSMKTEDIFKLDEILKADLPGIQKILETISKENAYGMLNQVAKQIQKENPKISKERSLIDAADQLKQIANLTQI